ncbi:MAG: DUF1848 domain-containing protein [Candidatus Woesearchaeota archaeon]
MILSVSRRTDIPAFYSDWFFNRIKDGFVMIRNPFNNQISKVDISPEVIDCIVFWTKNPEPMIERLEELKNYNYYFQYTINPYSRSLEQKCPNKTKSIKTFIELSQKIGKEKVVWRYDPIILTNKISKDLHYKYFETIAKYLSSYTEKCIISFLDLYKKVEENLKNINLNPITDDNIFEIAFEFKKIADKYNIEIETCSEQIDLYKKTGIKHGRCIDAKLISKIIGGEIEAVEDKGQRAACGCMASIDIGIYNTCKHGCLYCYATGNKKLLNKNIKKHDVSSPLLIGQLSEREDVKIKKIKSFLKKYEGNLFS